MVQRLRIFPIGDMTSLGWMVAMAMVVMMIMMSIPSVQGFSPRDVIRMPPPTIAAATTTTTNCRTGVRSKVVALFMAAPDAGQGGKRTTPIRNDDGTIQDDPTVIVATNDDDDWETVEESQVNPDGKINRFLEMKYPTFYKLLVRDNVPLRQALQDATQGHTLFVPNEAAMEALGATKLQQLLDPRNEEIRDKMGQYHVIAGRAVSATELRTEDWTRGRPKDGGKPQPLLAAIISLAGEVPVGRSKSGGMLFGLIGAKEDGDIVIGPNAQIVQSFQVEGCLVHEMTDLISPVALWRYVDQLRIPGF